MTVRVRIVVRGRVQGVGFRASCARQARSLGLAGSVRNLPDGSVEVIAEGGTDEVETLAEWCERGPTFAQVSSIDRTDQTPLGEKRFRIST